MKLHDVDDRIEVSGGEAIAMTINASSGIGFSLQIDKMYQQKIPSVIREICSNARDSHYEAGIPDEPFDVTLPSEINPYLVIKDHGLGLSKEDAIKYLGQLYSSSKQASNVAVGAYGLGSKSPFAISDTYNIETIKDGHKCYFQFFRSGRSLPQLMLISEEETDEPNGVTFRIHVKDTNRQKYIDALKIQLLNFHPKPNIDGLPWSYEPPKVLMEKVSGISVIDSYLHSNFFGSYAVNMGGVTYPLIPSEISPDLYKSFNALTNTFSNSTLLIIDVPIGSIEIPGDRERIEYSEYTINNMSKLLDGIFSVVTKNVVEAYYEEMRSIKSYTKALSKKKSFNSTYRSLFDHIGDLLVDEILTFPGYNKQHYNHKGELVDGTKLEININPSEVESPYDAVPYYVSPERIVDNPSYFNYKIKLSKYDYIEQIKCYQLKFIEPHYQPKRFDIPSKQITIKNITPKYTISDSVYISDSSPRVKNFTDINRVNEYGAFGYDSVHRIFVLIDDKKPASRILAHLIDNADSLKIPSNSKLVFLKDADEVKDFSYIYDIINNIKDKSELTRFIKSSELNLVIKKVERQSFNLSGVRKIHLRFDDMNSRNYFKYKNKEFKKYSSFKDLDSDLRLQKIDFYGYVDLESHKIYADKAMTIEINIAMMTLLARVMYGSLKYDVLLISKSNVNKMDGIIKEHRLLSIGRFRNPMSLLNTLTPREHKLFREILAIRSLSKSEFKHCLESPKNLVIGKLMYKRLSLKIPLIDVNQRGDTTLSFWCLVNEKHKRFHPNTYLNGLYLKIYAMLYLCSSGFTESNTLLSDMTSDTRKILKYFQRCCYNIKKNEVKKHFDIIVQNRIKRPINDEESLLFTFVKTADSELIQKVYEENTLARLNSRYK